MHLGKPVVVCADVVNLPKFDLVVRVTMRRQQLLRTELAWKYRLVERLLLNCAAAPQHTGDRRVAADRVNDVVLAPLDHAVVSLSAF